MFQSYVYLLAWVYGLGLLAAAPIGPVNTVAINRGVIGKWTHTLACGFGSALVDLSYFALALWGGKQVVQYFNRPGTQAVLAGLCVAILMPLGIRFLIRSARATVWSVARARRKMQDQPPAHLWTDVGTGAALTVINPAAPAYWIAVAAPWLGQARESLGAGSFWWGLVVAAAGLLSWFSFVAFLVRFSPNRLGAPFFRAVYAFSGLLLLGFSIVSLRTLILHTW